MTKDIKKSLDINYFAKSLIRLYELAQEKEDREQKKKTLTIPSELVPKGIRTKVAEKIQSRKGIKLIYQKSNNLGY